MKLATLKPRLATLNTTRIKTLEEANPERLRGRAAVERRARYLRLNPLCKACDEQGRITAATTPDHIEPLWRGGKDDESNLQPLCDPCHAAKTAREATERFKR